MTSPEMKSVGPAPRDTARARSAPAGLPLELAFAFDPAERPRSPVRPAFEDMGAQVEPTAVTTLDQYCEAQGLLPAPTRSFTPIRCKMR